ncbi:MAG TPA: hypothetical protein PKE37_16375 [Thiomonas arsenitoxydans]|uniref:hypothetical protein n=1 Tax=Thiomonas arsenitoxydans (strain DSM 22701 / CIP 110005 / 3As) TaxID=426114 RepID=UPI002BB32AC7|nr:hypothetical protein [Thiomonas arsenitoxydans]HML83331.1 hypothetical protein [Thiomonas arsenitoxydans]
MTPAEVAAKLRAFNEWRRSDEDIPQPDPREIGEAIDAAVDMIERLEAAESEAIEQARLNGMGSEREAALMAKLEAAEKALVRSEKSRSEAADYFANRMCRLNGRLSDIRDERDALRAKITRMEQQEPVGTLHDDGCFVWRETAPHQSNYAGWKMALYALPDAKGEDK